MGGHGIVSWRTKSFIKNCGTCPRNDTHSICFAASLFFFLILFSPKLKKTNSPLAKKKKKIKNQCLKPRLLRNQCRISPKKNPIIRARRGIREYRERRQGSRRRSVCSPNPRSFFFPGHTHTQKKKKQGNYVARQTPIPGVWVGFWIEMDYAGFAAEPQQYTSEVSIVPRTFPAPPCSGESCTGFLV